MIYLSRKRGTNRDGRSFSEQTVQAVWEKTQIVPNYDPRDWRKDKCGALIARAAYGNTDNKYGWEIDHIYPVSKGGTDDLRNLQALQWENNRRKGDNYPWSC